MAKIEKYTTAVRNPVIRKKRSVLWKKSLSKRIWILLGIIVMGESSSGLNFVKAADQLRPEAGHQTPDPKRITGIFPHSKFKCHNKPQ